MAELLLVANPRRRRKSRRNPSRSRRARSRSNPRRRRHRARINPVRRRRSRRNPSIRHYARRARRHVSRMFRRRRARSNPSLRSITSAIMPTAKAGLIGAGGALALDAVWGLAAPYIPAAITSNVTLAPYAQFALKGLLAVLVGWGGGHLLKGKGRDLAVGAMTVATHDFLKANLQNMAPTLFGPGGTLALSGYSGMGAYLSGSAPIVGTATFPQTYLPQSQNVQMGAYLSGSSGSDDGGGSVYADDAMGQAYWS